MGKKTDDFTADDIDVDDDFDLNELDNLGMDEDFGDSFGEVSNKRETTPPLDIKEVAKGVASAETVSAIGSKIGNEFTNISSIYDTSTDVVSELDRYKTDMLKDIAPAISQSKRAMRIYLPKAEGMMPKKLYSKISGLIKEEEEYSSPSEEQLRNATVSDQLADIFSAQEEQEFEKESYSRTHDLVEARLDASRHTESVSVLSQIRNILKSNQLFTSGIFRKYLMKSLELKYRHIFVAQDTLKKTSETFALLNLRLKEISKNTGLPDVVKKRRSEAIKEQLRAKGLSAGLNSLGNVTANFRKNLMGNIKDNVFQKTTDTVNTILGGVSEAAIGQDELERMGEEFGDKKKSALTKGVTSLARTALIKMGVVGAKAGVGQQKFEDMDELAGTIKKNFALKVSDYVNGTDENSMIGGLLRTIVPTIEEERGEISNSYVTSGADDIGFDIAARKSLIDIIPGLLSKIQKVTADIRGAVITKTRATLKGSALDKFDADTNNEELVFDKESETFISASEFASKMEKEFLGTKESRTTEIANIIGIMKAGHEMHGGSSDEFDKYRPDIVRVVSNIAKHAKLVSPKRILKYLKGEKLSPQEDSYLESVFTDIPEDKRSKLADILVTSFFTSDELNEDTGALEPKEDKDVTNTLTNLITNLAVSRDAYVDKLHTFEVHGNKRHAGNLIADKTEATKQKIADDIKRKYLTKYTAKKLNKDDDLRRKMDIEIKAAQSKKGLNHAYIRDKMADVDDDLLGQLSSNSAEDYRAVLEKKKAARNLEDGTTVTERISKALLDEVKQTIKPLTEAYERITPDINKLKDSKIASSVAAAKDTAKAKLEGVDIASSVAAAKDAATDQLDKLKDSKIAKSITAAKDSVMDKLSDETDIPNRDAVQVSGPGLYYQGVDRELHMPLDDNDEVKLKEALEKTNISDERQRAEMLKQALKEFIASKGVNLANKKTLEDLDSSEEDAELTDIIDPEEAAKQKAKHIRDILKRENVSTSRRRFKYQGQKEWSYPDVPNVPKKSTDEFEDHWKASLDEEWIGGEDTISPKSKSEIDTIRTKTKIPHRDDTQISKRGSFWQGVAKELHIPLRVDDNGKVSIDIDNLKSNISDTTEQLREALESKKEKHAPGFAKHYQTFKDKASDTLNTASDKASEFYENASLNFASMGGINGAPPIIPKATETAEASPDILTEIRDLLRDHTESSAEWFQTKQSVDMQIIQLLSMISAGDNPEAIKKAGLMSKVLAVPKAGIKGAKWYTSNVVKQYKKMFSLAKKGAITTIKSAIKNNRITRGLKAGLDIGKKGLGLVKKGADIYSSGVKTIGKTLFKGIRASAKGLKAAFTNNKYVDVYRKDEVNLGNPLVKGDDIKSGLIMFKSGKALPNSYSIKEPCYRGSDKTLVVSEADIKHGLVNYMNKPLKAAIGRRILSKAFAGIKGIGSLAKKGAELYKDAVVGTTKLGLNMFKKLPGIRNIFGSKESKEKGIKGKITNTTLQELVTKHLLSIIDLLDPISKKFSVSKREGGYKDYFDDKAATKTKRTARKDARQKKVKGNAKGRFKGRFMGMAGAGASESGGLISDMLSMAGETVLDNVVSKVMSGGKGMVGKAAGLAAKALPGLGVLGSAGTALASGAASVGSGAMAAGTFLATNPVGWAILGTMAVGAAGYGIHKWFKGKKAKLKMTSIRNYGYQVPQNKIKVLYSLEKDYYEAKEDSEELTNGELLKYGKKFGLDMKDPKQYKYFMQWYKQVFEPVFKAGLEILLRVFDKDYKDQTDLDKKQVSEYQGIFEKSNSVSMARGLGLIMSPEGYEKYAKGDAEDEPGRDKSPDKAEIATGAVKPVADKVTGKQPVDKAKLATLGLGGTAIGKLVGEDKGTGTKLTPEERLAMVDKSEDKSLLSKAMALTPLGLGMAAYNKLTDKGPTAKDSIDASKMSSVDSEKISLLRSQVKLLSKITTLIDKPDQSPGEAELNPAVIDKLDELIATLKAHHDNKEIPQKRNQSPSIPKVLKSPGKNAGISVAKQPVTSIA